jgi:hypothetical protein
MESILEKLNIVIDELLIYLKLIFSDNEEGVVKPIITTFNLSNKVKDESLKNFLFLDIAISNQGLPKQRLINLEK